jgi:hypothetical protein
LQNGVIAEVDFGAAAAASTIPTDREIIGNGVTEYD